MVERNMNIIELKGFSASVMEILLDSIYGESATVTRDNVQDILPAASLLQLNGTGLTFVIARFRFISENSFRYSTTMCSLSC